VLFFFPRAPGREGLIFESFRLRLSLRFSLRFSPTLRPRRFDEVLVEWNRGDMSGDRSARRGDDDALLLLLPRGRRAPLDREPLCFTRLLLLTREADAEFRLRPRLFLLSFPIDLFLDDRLVLALTCGALVRSELASFLRESLDLAPFPRFSDLARR